MAMEVAELVAKLSADISDFTRKMDDAKDQMAKLTGVVEEHSGKIGGSFSEAGAKAIELNQALELLHKAADFIKETTAATAEWGDHLVHLSEEFGVNTNTLQIWQQQMVKTGQPVDGMEMLIRRLSNAMVTGREGINTYSAILTKMGIDMNSSDIAGQVMKLAIAISNMDDVAMRNTIMTKLGGRQAIHLIPTLLTMAAGEETAAADAKRLGTFTEEQVAFLAEANHAANDMTIAWGSLMHAIGIEAAPSYMASMEWLTDILVLLRTSIPEALAKVKQVFGDVKAMLESFADSINVFDFLGKNADAIKHPIDTMIAGLKRVKDELSDVLKGWSLIYDVGKTFINPAERVNTGKGWWEDQKATMAANADAMMEAARKQESWELMKKYWLEKAPPVEEARVDAMGERKGAKMLGIQQEEYGAMVRDKKIPMPYISMPVGITGGPTDEDYILDIQKRIAAATKLEDEKFKLDQLRYKADLTNLTEAEKLKSAVVQSNLKIQAVSVADSIKFNLDAKVEELDGARAAMEKNQKDTAAHYAKLQDITIGKGMKKGSGDPFTREQAMELPDTKAKLAELTFAEQQAQFKITEDLKKNLNERTLANLKAYDANMALIRSKPVAELHADISIAKAKLETATLGGADSQTEAELRKNVLTKEYALESLLLERKMEADSLIEAKRLEERAALYDVYRQKIRILDAKATNDFAMGWRDGMKDVVHDYGNGYTLMIDMTKQTASAMQGEFNTIFFDAFEGKLHTWQDLWKMTMTNINKITADILSKMVTQWIMSMEVMGGAGTGTSTIGKMLAGGASTTGGGVSGGGVGSLLGGIPLIGGFLKGLLPGGGGSGGVGGIEGTSLMSMGSEVGASVGASNFVGLPFTAEGGIFSGPTARIIGEAGPEAVIPLDRMGKMGGHTTVHMNITTPDVGSFRQSRDQILVEMQRAMVRAQRNV